jgi:hypothetical protein
MLTVTVDFGVSLICAALSLKSFIDSFGIWVGYPSSHRGFFDSKTLIMNKAAKLLSLVVCK